MLDAVVTGVPAITAASREDSRLQAILKLQPRNSFDYRVRYEPQLLVEDIQLLIFWHISDFFSLFQLVQMRERHSLQTFTVLFKSDFSYGFVQKHKVDCSPLYDLQNTIV